jgi:hypothetical protein
MWNSVFIILLVSTILALLVYIALKKDSPTLYPPSLLSNPSLSYQYQPQTQSQIQPQIQSQIQSQYQPQNQSQIQVSLPHENSCTYFPQSLNMPRNVYLDYINDTYNTYRPNEYRHSRRYYPGYNYTWDNTFYNWDKKDRKSINIENNPQFSLNQTFQTHQTHQISPDQSAPISPSPTFAPEYFKPSPTTSPTTSPLY